MLILCRMSREISLSVALVTRDRPDPLRNCLISLRAQSVQPYEVIISDDSGPEYAQATRAVAENFGCSYRVGPRRGLYANRNFVAKLCSGSHVRTMDDDHILPPGHLSRCLEAVERDPNAIWTTGEIAFVDGGPISKADTANQLGPAGVGEPIKNLDDNWGIADGSTIYPRPLFDRGLQMVEDFGFGSSYLEFGAYVYSRGWKSRCITNAAVEHHVVELSQPDPLSCVFASICFNRHFRPDALRLIRHLLPRWKMYRTMTQLFEKAARRWTNS
jgi:glycosyltransferase involved in cell wall biosynthesis